MSWRGFTIRHPGCIAVHTRAFPRYKLKRLFSGWNRVEPWTSRKINPSIINRRKEQNSPEGNCFTNPVSPKTHQPGWYFIPRRWLDGRRGRGEGKAISRFAAWIISLYIIMRNNAACDLHGRTRRRSAELHFKFLVECKKVYICHNANVVSLLHRICLLVCLLATLFL